MRFLTLSITFIFIKMIQEIHTNAFVIITGVLFISSKDYIEIKYLSSLHKRFICSFNGNVFFITHIL